MKKTPAVLVLFAWLLVGTPWAWGVTQLWKNAKKLFITPPPATTMAPVTTAPAAPAGSPAPAAPAK
ncbi:MAG TPA: hypothetical protein VHA06_02625 [Candidatus Angelobacter sp.]|nr:hypothetical protein [Candidatus Angelobacter sp.]